MSMIKENYSKVETQSHNSPNIPVTKKAREIFKCLGSIYSQIIKLPGDPPEVQRQSC